MVQIRPATRDDYPAIVAIRNTIQPDPITADDLRRRDEAFGQHTGTKQQRLVAETDRRILGMALIRTVENEPTQISLAVETAARHRGIGQQLLTAALSVAEGHGAELVKGEVRGDDDDSYAWALARGFRLDRQRTESVLDLTRWDDALFAGELGLLEQQGIRLVRMAAYPEPGLLRQIHGIYHATHADVPGRDWVFPEYDEWLISFASEYRDAPPAIGLALDGERLVGVSVLEMPRPGRTEAFVDYTGVLPGYRGRGIALAVKVLTVQQAIAAGVQSIRTNNDPDNPPMLAVNRKMGFAFIPGPRVLKKRLCERGSEEAI